MSMQQQWTKSPGSWRGVSIVAAVAVAALIGLWLTPNELSTRTIAARLLSLVATMALARRLMMLPDAVRAVWVAIWLYQAITVLADLLYDSVYALNGVPPLFSETDVMYLITYVCAFEAIRRLENSVVPYRDRRATIDVATIGISMIGIVLAFIALPRLFVPEGVDMAGLISAAYPMLDFVIVVALVRVLVIQRLANPALFMVAAAFIIFLGYDLAYDYFSFMQDWTEYRMLEVSWTAALLLLTFASYAPGSRSFGDPDLLGETPAPTDNREHASQ